MHLNPSSALLGLISCCLSTAALSQPVSKEEGARFFREYLKLDATYDVSFVELYSDDSRIRTLRRYPTGQTRHLEITGAQWKSLMLAALPLAKARGDRSEYKNPTFEISGEDLRVKAERYSVLRCYWDRGFVLTLSRLPNGRIFIKDQYLETQPDSNC